MHYVVQNHIVDKTSNQFCNNALDKKCFVVEMKDYNLYK